MFIYCLFLLSLGTFDLKKQFALSLLFQNMWEHLSHLSVAIDAQLIGNEGFEVSGLTTAYFLPFPSVVRGALSLIGLSESAILSAALGALVFSIASLLIYQNICLKQGTVKNPWEKLSIGGALICTLLSPIMGMMSYPTVFWEAIIWASSLFLLSCAISIHILEKQNVGGYSLALLAVACGATLFTRATFSFSACILFTLTTLVVISRQTNTTIGLRKNIYLNHNAIFSIILFGIFLIGLLTLNYFKWGNPFEFYPLQYYKMWDEAQKEVYLSHGALNLTRIPETFSYYFIPSADNFAMSAPYVRLGDIANVGVSGNFDYKEPPLAISLTQPISVFLFVIGLIVFASKILLKPSDTITRLLWPAAIASLIPIIFILSIHSLSIRYAGDFLPAVVVFGMLGLKQISTISATLQANIDDKRKWNIARKSNFALAPKIVIALIAFYLSLSGVLLQDKLWESFLTYNLIPIKYNETVNFKLHGNNEAGVGYLHKGWSAENELFGTWSDSRSATLLVGLPNNISSKDFLTITAKAFVTPQNPEQTIEIKVNGKQAQTIRFTDAELHKITIQPKAFEHHLTASLFNRLVNFMGIKNYEQPYSIEFHMLNPISPKQAGISNDDRLLGIGLVSIILQ